MASDLGGQYDSAKYLLILQGMVRLICLSERIDGANEWLDLSILNQLEHRLHFVAGRGMRSNELHLLHDEVLKGPGVEVMAGLVPHQHEFPSPPQAMQSGLHAVARPNVVEERLDALSLGQGANAVRDSLCLGIDRLIGAEFSGKL